MLVVLLYGVDVVLLGRASWEMLAVRLIWALALLVTGGVMKYTTPLQAQWVSAGYGVVAALCYLGLVAFGGGTQGPYFSFFPAIPLMIAMVSSERLGAPLACGFASALGGGWMLHATGTAPLHAVLWATMMLAMMGFGLYGRAQYRQARSAEGEMRLERSRREALEKLAVSERHRAQSEKLATLGRLAASVAHELNNPIAYVRSNLDFIGKELQRVPVAPQEELREAMLDVNSGVERIGQIVADLRCFSRVDAAEEPSRCSLATVVKDAARLASVRLKSVARLRVEVSEALPDIHVVPRRLAQVILNLLVNASDALEAHRSQESEVRVRAHVKGEAVQLLIEDNGPGFPEEVLPRLFEPFFTTKGPEKGTGLGLMLSREYVEEFGGTLTATNREEGGARLCIQLPACARPRASAAA